MEVSAISTITDDTAVKGGLTPEDLRDLIQTSLDSDKAEDIVTIDLRGKTTIADYMIVANGRSTRQVNALADKILDRLRNKGMKSVRVEGLAQGDWVVIDAGDVVVHLFRPEVRDFYNIEKIWGVEHGAGDQVMYLSA